MRLSLVIPTLNRAATLDRTLASLVDQDVEIVAVDGGSTDGSAEILERHRDRLARLVREPDRGHYDAVNKGFALCSGEIMGWLGGDDMLLPGTAALVTWICSGRHECDTLSRWRATRWRPRPTPAGARSSRRIIAP
ncbi:MAG: glycosyltransferase [Caulobacter sp.]|nr:glycosyltransferase [Caulobacter sp.]